MTEKNSEQVRAEHVRVLGEKLGEVYNALWQEAVWLHFEWQQHEKLFSQSEEILDTLNELAGAFFWTTQRIFFENILLSISRLTGPVRSVGHENLTIRQLPLLASDRTFASELDELIKHHEASWAFTTPWRHKLLAHRDLSTALGRGAERIPSTTRADVEQAVKAIATVLNRVEAKYFDSEVFYHLHEPRDADALVHFLSLAKKVDDAELASLLADTATSLLSSAPGL
jgi:hypothetical protein